MGITNRKVALAVAATALLGLGAVGGYSAHKQAVVAAACDSIRNYYQETGGVIHYPGAGPRIVILGDSYTTGDMLPDRSQAWPAQFAAKSGADVYVVGEGGTGFVNEGFCGTGSFAERLDAALDLQPATLVVAGGLNDAGQDVSTPVNRLLDRTREIDSVYLLGPVDSEANDGEAEVSRQMESASHEFAVTFVSALSWDGLAYGADGLHLTARGHAAYANHVFEIVDSAPLA